MNSQPKRVLWTTVEPADALSARLTEEAESLDLPESFRETVKEASNRLYDQQNQLGGLIIHLMNTIPLEQVIMLLLKVGFSRHELASCWGVDKDYILMVESTMQAEEAAKANAASNS